MKKGARKTRKSAAFDFDHFLPFNANLIHSVAFSAIHYHFCLFYATLCHPAQQKLFYTSKNQSRVSASHPVLTLRRVAVHDVERDGAVLLVGGVHHHRVQGAAGDDLVQHLQNAGASCWGRR